MSLNEPSEMIRHRPNVARNQHSLSIGRDSQYFRIRRTIAQNSRRRAEINQRLSPPQSPANLRVQVGVGLKANGHACFSARNWRVCSKRSAISGVNGYCSCTSRYSRS